MIIFESLSLMLLQWQEGKESWCMWERNSSYALTLPYLFRNFCFNESDEIINICVIEALRAVVSMTLTTFWSQICIANQSLVLW